MRPDRPFLKVHRDMLGEPEAVDEDGQSEPRKRGGGGGWGGGWDAQTVGEQEDEQR